MLPNSFRIFFFTVTGTFFCYWWWPHLHPKPDKHWINNSTVHRGSVIRKRGRKSRCEYNVQQQWTISFSKYPFFAPLLLCFATVTLLYWANWWENVNIEIQGPMSYSLWTSDQAPKNACLANTVSIAVTAGIPLTSCFAKNFVEQDFLLNTFMTLGRELVVPVVLWALMSVQWVDVLDQHGWR